MKIQSLSYALALALVVFTQNVEGVKCTIVDLPWGPCKGGIQTRGQKCVPSGCDSCSISTRRKMCKSL
jgi:hypothetical protein